MGEGRKGGGGTMKKKGKKKSDTAFLFQCDLLQIVTVFNLATALTGLLMKQSLMH